MKKTTGGAFDPHDDFIYFLATSAARHSDGEKVLGDGAIPRYPHVLVAVNELETKKARDDVDRLLGEGRKVLLDSGIFNLAMTHARTHGVSHDVALSLHPTEIDGFDRLKDLYYEVATRDSDRMWGIIEMDQGGALVKPETRAMIERDTGIIPMPVIHPLLDGWDYYHAVAAEYDRMCIGNLVKAAPSLRIRLLHKTYMETRKHPDTWHHLLGVTPSDLAYSLPIRGSSDSSTWLSGVRWMQGWHARSMGKSVGNYVRDMWYAKGDNSYYKVDGVSIRNSQALEASVRDERSIA